jgi:hypothetical protein
MPLEMQRRVDVQVRSCRRIGGLSLLGLSMLALSAPAAAAEDAVAADDAGEEH